MLIQALFFGHFVHLYSIIFAIHDFDRLDGDGDEPNLTTAWEIS